MKTLQPRYFLSVPILVCLVLTAAPRLFAQMDPLDTWKWLNPLPQGNDLQNLAFANKTFFAMGPSQTLVTSSNGLDWSAQFSNVSETFRDVTWAGGMYLAVAGGSIFTSPDGEDWTRRVSQPFAVLNAVVYGSGVFVAAGDPGVILTSPDAINWTLRSSFGPNVTDVKFNNGLFVMSAYGIYTSTDAIVWTHRFSLNGGFFTSGQIAYGNNRWVVSGGASTLAASSDGMHWTLVVPGAENHYRRVAFGNGQFLALGLDNLALSTDGFKWTEIPNSPDGLPLYDLLALTWGAGRFVAAFRGGGLASSENGTNWIIHANGDRSNLWRAAAGNGQLVTGTGDGHLYSLPLTGGRLEFRDLSINPPIGSISLLTFSHGMFLAIDSNAQTFRSADATNWTQGEAFPINNYVQDAIHVAGRDYFVGDFEAVVISEDGTNFVEEGANQVKGRGIAYGNSRFVSVYENQSYLSLDGTNWTSTAHDESLSTIAFGNGRFVALGPFGDVAVSTNGEDWSFSGIGSLSISRVLWQAGRFTAIGASAFLNLPSPLVLSSTNGEDWQYHSLPVTEGTVNDAVAAGGRVYLVGENGIVLESGLLEQTPPRLEVSLMNQDTVWLKVRGEPGSRYQLEYCERMSESSSWTPLTNIVLSGSAGPSVELPSTTARARFYRAVLLP